MPKISVIVPVYNSEKYLRRCIDSILAQSFTDFELLLIDDGSSDGSPAICDEYAARDPRVRVFHKPNGGVSSARNLGLDNARGEWIAFADSDDWVYECWLQNFMVDNLESYDLICQGLHTENINGDITISSFEFKEFPVNLPIILYKEKLYGYLFIKLFKKEIIQNNDIHFNLQLKYKEDEVFVINYLSNCKNKCKGVANIGYYYFEPNWTKKYNLSNLEDKKLDIELIRVYSIFCNNFGLRDKSAIAEHLSFLAPRWSDYIKISQTSILYFVLRFLWLIRARL